MEELTRLIREDMRPALGVTEPGAIAFAVSKARTYVKGAVTGVELRLNSGMYKNAYTCGIPNNSFMGNGTRLPWDFLQESRKWDWNAWQR